MHTQIKKKISAFLLSLVALFMFAAPAYVNIGTANSAANFGLDDAKTINVSGEEATEASVKTTIAKIVNTALGFLGILAVIIIIYAGFKWMTASGNEDQVADAKKMLMQAVIGLTIIFLGYVITSFVVNQLQETVGNA